MITLRELLSEDFNPDMGTGVKPTVEKAKVKPVDTTDKVEVDDFEDEDEVNQKIEDAEDDADAVDTVTFGLETDDDQIVKVYVAITDADAFEEKLSAMLGEVDDIEELLKTLGEEFDIVDIEWPDDEDAEKEEDEPEEDLEDESDVSDEEDPEEKEPKSKEEKEAAKEAILSRLRDKLAQRLNEDTVDIAIDPDTNDIMQRYQNQYTQLGLAVLMELGLTPVMIKLMISRNPAYVRELTIKMRELGNVNRNLLRRVFTLNKDNKDVEPE